MWKRIFHNSSLLDAIRNTNHTDQIHYNTTVLEGRQVLNDLFHSVQDGVSTNHQLLESNPQTVLLCRHSNTSENKTLGLIVYV